MCFGERSKRNINPRQPKVSDSKIIHTLFFFFSPLRHVFVKMKLFSCAKLSVVSVTVNWSLKANMSVGSGRPASRSHSTSACEHLSNDVDSGRERAGVLCAYI